MKNTYFSVKPGAKGSEFYGGGNSQGLSDKGTKYQGTSGKGLRDQVPSDQVPSDQVPSDQVPSTNDRTTSVECPGNHPVITLLSPRNHPLLGSGGQVVTDRGEVLADRRGVLADRREVLADRRGVVAMMRQKCMMWKYVAMLLAVLVLSVGNIGMAWGANTTAAAGTYTLTSSNKPGSENKFYKLGNGVYIHRRNNSSQDDNGLKVISTNTNGIAVYVNSSMNLSCSIYKASSTAAQTVGINVYTLSNGSTAFDNFESGTDNSTTVSVTLSASATYTTSVSFAALGSKKAETKSSSNITLAAGYYYIVPAETTSEGKTYLQSITLAAAPSGPSTSADTPGASGTVTFTSWTSLSTGKSCYWKDGIKCFQYSSGGLGADAPNFTSKVDFGYMSVTAGSGWGSYNMSGLVTYAHFALGVSITTPSVVEVIVDNNQKNDLTLARLFIKKDDVSYNTGYGSGNYTSGTDIKSRATITRVTDNTGRYKISIPVSASDLATTSPYIIKFYSNSWTNPIGFVFESVTVKPVYTVTYNANGKDGGGAAPTDGSSPYVSGSNVTVLGNTNSMTKTDCVFNGWNTRSDGTGTHYDVGDVISSISENITLYAEWVGYATSWNWWESGQSNDGTTFTYITSKNYICSFASSASTAVASWDMDGGEYYRGIKIKTKDHYMYFWVQAGKRVSITFGTRPTKPTFTVGGVDKSSDVGASTNSDSITVTYTTTADTKFYIENETATKTAFTIKSIKIENSCTAPNHVDITPTTEDGNYGWRYTTGETLKLTATAYSSAGTGSPISSGITSYQWQKYVDSDWEDLSDGGTISGATTANLQISNLTSSDGGSYRCEISTGATCTTPSDGYWVRIFTLDGNYYNAGDWVKNKIVWTGENTGVATVSLNASSTYMFKVTDNDGKWFGSGAGNYIIEGGDSKDCGTGNNDIRLFTGPAGNYTFTVDITNAAAGSPYVNVVTGYPEVSHPATGYMYVSKWWDCYPHWWDGSGNVLTSDGSDPKITKYTTICGNDYWYMPVLDNYTNIAVKDNATWSSAENNSGDQSTTGHSGWLLTNNGSWGWQEFTTYTVTAAASTAGYGTVSAASVTGVACGTSISASTNTLSVGATNVTATPASATAEYTYAFDNWAWTPAGATVTSDVTATANFTRTLNSYTVTWKNGATTLETDASVNYGVTPTYDGSTPTKAADALYTYTFSGWSPAVGAISGNTTYTAQFTATPKTVAYGDATVYAYNDSKRVVSGTRKTAMETALAGSDGDETAISGSLPLLHSIDGLTSVVLAGNCKSEVKTSFPWLGSYIKMRKDDTAGTITFNVESGYTGTAIIYFSAYSDSKAATLTNSANSASITSDKKSVETEGNQTSKNIALVSGANTLTISGNNGYISRIDVTLVVSYTLTYNANAGGDAVSGLPDPENHTAGTYALSSSVPTRSGYIFDGWYENSSCTGTRYAAGGDFTISDDAILYAKWIALSEKCLETNHDWTEIAYAHKTSPYEGVTYDLGGINDDASSITLTPAEGEGYVHFDISSLGIIKEIEITLSGVGEPSAAEKGLYYAFDKTFWDYNEDYTETDGYYFELSGSEVIRLHPTGDATKCTFSAYGTTVSISEFCIYYEPSCTDPELGFESASLTKYTGESVSNTLTNTHSVEVSYSSSDKAVATVNSSGEVTIKGVGTTTITATAAAQTVSAVSYCADAASYDLTVNPYTITYNLNGGAWGEVSHKDTYTKFDDGYDLPTPTKTDYTFLGWYENSEFTGDRVYILPAGSTGNKTYYAKWGSAVTATWSVTKVDSKLYRGGGGHHVTAVLDQAEWDASGSANDLDLSASEGVTLSSVTKGVYTSGDNDGKAYVEAAFSISGDIDEDEIWFFLNVPAAGEYAAAELSKKLTLNDCPIVVGSPTIISIFDGTTDTEKPSSKTNNKYKQSTQFTNATTGFKYELHGIKGDLIDISEATYTGRGDYTRAIQWGGGSASYYAEFIVPTGYTASITITYVLTANSPQYIGFGTTKAAQANGSNYNINETISSNNVVGTSTFSSLSSGTYYYVCSGGTSFYILGVSATLTPTSGVPGVPTTLSWSGSLADKAEVNTNNEDADFIYTATPSTNTIGAITYTSSDESVATVDGNGKVHIIKGGETTITATLAESGCYTGAEITYTLKVKSTCADVRGTIVAADGSAIAGNSIEKGACETVTLKLTGYTDGATIQWQKDGANISGATSAEYTVPEDGAGVYTAVTKKNCDLTSNSVTVTSASSTIEPTIFADEFTVKDERPFEYRLMQLNEGETCTVTSATSWKDKHDFEITTEGNIVTIKGYIGIESNYNETITLKISNSCSDIYKDIRIHATTESPKPMIAWIATGDKGVKDNVLADQSTNTALYKALKAKDKYALTPRNCYWTTDEKELIKEYSQYDLVILTDYPNSRKGPDNEDDRSKSYTNALGLLIDRVPMLTFEAFVAGCPNWGFSSNPKNTNSTQNSLTLLCNANDIFDTSDKFNAGASVEVGTVAEGEGQQALQGFELDAMPNFVFIAKITDSGKDYVTCCERQVNTTARMMVFGLNQNLMNAITKTGEDMVAGFVDYLLVDENASIPDCSVIFKGREETGGTDWSNTSNWEGASLPNPYASVRIDAPCVVGDDVTAKAGMIKIHTGSEGGYTYTGSLTIQPRGRMIVENGVYRVEGTNYATYLPTEPNNLVINADAGHTGALIFSNPRRDTQATVYLYSKATTSENTCWQYVGIPFGSLSPAVSWFYNAWMMKYTTGTTTGDTELYSWEYINNYDVLNGFQGYALTQTAAKSYQLQGGLAPTTDKVLAVSNAGGNGWNLYANSWTAPIHIDKMEASDFVNADATIYLYNTGSRADWDGTTVDEAGTSTTAGQYLAVPVGLAEYTGTKYIPSMQGFFVQGNHASAAGSVRLRYDAVVRDTTVMADLNTPLRTPSRETVNQEPEHVTMVVRGEKYTDVLHLFRSDEWSAGYENGYDAHKVEGDDYTPQLYAVTGKEELAVVATDEWEGTVLNFRAGSEDVEYTIFFRYNESEAEALYLYDLTTETYTRIENGGSYHFSTTDKETHPRFILTYNAPSVATGTGDVQRDDVQSTKARKVLLDNHVYIFRNGKLYNSTGKMVK